MTVETTMTADRALTITRLLDAPSALVFRLWTQPEHLVRWWGPRDFTVPSCRIDVRPGGSYRICIRSAEGKDYWMEGVYREVTAPERLVFTFTWLGDHTAAGHEMLVTVTFAAEGERTRMTFHQAEFPSVEERDGHEAGWSECFDRLAAYLLEARAA